MKKGKWATGQIKLSVKGKPLEVQVTVPANPVKPQRMLPIFQKITNLFVDIGVKETEQQRSKKFPVKKAAARAVGNPFRCRNLKRIILPK